MYRFQPTSRPVPPCGRAAAPPRTHRIPSPLVPRSVPLRPFLLIVSIVSIIFVIVVIAVAVAVADLTGVGQRLEASPLLTRLPPILNLYAISERRLLVLVADQTRHGAAERRGLLFEASAPCLRGPSVPAYTASESRADWCLHRHTVPLRATTRHSRTSISVVPRVVRSQVAPELDMTFRPEARSRYSR